MIGNFLVELTVRVFPMFLWLGAAGGEGAEGGSPDRDFRLHVWVAYGVVLVFLCLFTLWTVVQTRSVERKVDHLKEIFRKAHPDVLDDGDH